MFLPFYKSKIKLTMPYLDVMQNGHVQYYVKWKDYDQCGWVFYGTMRCAAHC